MAIIGTDSVNLDDFCDRVVAFEALGERLSDELADCKFRQQAEL